MEDYDAAAEREEFERWLGLQEEEAVEPGDLGDISPAYIELEKIPRRLWAATLDPLHRSQRMYVATQVRDPKLRDVAMSLALEIDLGKEERAIRRQEERGRARRRSAPLPSPGAEHGAARPSIQVNVRLRADDHARLSDAAAAVGMRPTTLARALILNGVTMILRDHAQLAA